MAKKMLIDATHPEETRVVVLDGSKLEDFDFESASKRQIAGNIYLAKVTRVEPSLQAAFVEYGGNRHGFLAFSEIHPDYYQIPKADREALIAEEAEAARKRAEADAAREAEREAERAARAAAKSAAEDEESEAAEAPEGLEIIEPMDDGEDGPVGEIETVEAAPVEDARSDQGAEATEDQVAEATDTQAADAMDAPVAEATDAPVAETTDAVAAPATNADQAPVAEIGEPETVETAAETPLPVETAKAVEAEPVEAPQEPLPAETSEDPRDVPTDESDAAEDDQVRKPDSIAEAAGTGDDETVEEEYEGTPRKRAEAAEGAQDAAAPIADADASVADADIDAPAEAQVADAGAAAPADASETVAETPIDEVTADAAPAAALDAQSGEAETAVESAESAADAEETSADGGADEAIAEDAAPEDAAAEASPDDAAEVDDDAAAEGAAQEAVEGEESAEAGEDDEAGEDGRRRRRSRRGGRSRRARKGRSRADGDEDDAEAASAEASEDGESEAADAETEAEEAPARPRGRGRGRGRGRDRDRNGDDDEVDAEGGDDMAEAISIRRIAQRRYKIQEVIKVRQILLVQVVKEERGNKGAALTTYLSLAGRYCVLMPNTARGGGISRKITSAADRKKLKDIAGELEVPQGMGLIVRTAGAKRSKSEIKRDYEYLLRAWAKIRDTTLSSAAPALIHEEGSLIKRVIRDMYSADFDAIEVEGEQGWREARDYMSMLMPGHSRNVVLNRGDQPLFHKFGVEQELDQLFNPTVQLKSGGYIVIGVTEALVAIDINSGKSTKEGSIEDTALKTNLEASDEIARQLKLRDLAGLIVIDYIDMEEGRNNRAVEKRLKDRLKDDRARIQVGRISGFGLMEMSRQRLRPGMIEATTAPCPHCHGTGVVRSDASLGLSILRRLAFDASRGRAAELVVKAPLGAATFLFNEKREHLARIEAASGVSVRLEADPTLMSPKFEIEKSKVQTRVPATALAPVPAAEPMAEEPEEAEARPEPPAEPAAEVEAAPRDGAEAAGAEDEDRNGARRRRGRRGGRRRKRSDEAEEGEVSTDDASEVVAEPGAEAAPAAVNGEAPEAVAEMPPPRKTRRRRKKAAEPEDAAPEAVADEAVVEASEEAGVEASPEGPAEAVPVEAPLADIAPEAQAPATTEAEPEAPVTIEAEAPAAMETSDAVGGHTSEAAPQDQGHETAEPPSSEAEAAPEAAQEDGAKDAPAEAATADVAVAVPDAEPEKKPRRRGWWSR